MTMKILEVSMLIIILTSKNASSNEPKICFYEDDNYHGEHICMNQGDNIKNLPMNLNDKFSSIRIPFGMEAIVYKDNKYSGIKYKLTRNMNIDELAKLGLNDEISSFRVMPASCFYSLSNFTGDGICLSTGRELDIYNENKSRMKNNTQVLSVLNDNIESITVPENNQVIIYESDNFGGNFYELTENIDYNMLLKIGMTEEISSIKTSGWSGLKCNLNCIIINAQHLSLPAIFGEVWHEERLPNKQLILSFDTQTKNEEFIVTIGSQLIVSVNKNEIIIDNLEGNSEISFYRNNNTENLAMIFQISSNQIQIMHMEIFNEMAIHATPLISYNFDTENETTATLTIKNLNNDEPLIINKAIAMADSGQSWSKRDGFGKVACWSNPFLNIYNYIVQGRCNQLDVIINNISKYFQDDHKGKSLHVAGEAVPITPTETAKIPQDTPAQLSLIYIYSNLNKQSISLPATAKACRVSIYPLISARQLRQIRPACITWTLEVLTDFTLLFGSNLDTWNADFFGEVIDSIIQNGDTGSKVKDKEIETRLIQGVTAQVALQSPQESATHFKTAFDYAQLSYANYLTRNDSPLAASPPQAVEQLLLGIYELDLDNYTYQETIPRILEQGHWVLHPELTFEVEIIEIPTPIEQELASASGTNVSLVQNESVYQHISRTAALWASYYESSQMPTDPSDKEIDEYTSITHAGRIVTGIIQRRLKIRRGGEVYVVVKLRGEIITIALADRFLSSHDVELVATATNPHYVLNPNADNTIREGGTVAARHLARYLKKRGARALIAEVISQPSARVKQKVGFNFKEEF
ncbi:GCN5-related N-acetyltransferase [Yersinia aldovae ATCC 35236]|uniref:N-acetyltransferase GCN5 n=1 Tax=Yersinia aldovae TaxID=29483 RepID=A0A0T9TT41_YERAL|nr:peptidase inhibitor family I36 protein [Yersinia aldovae]EEP95408.1 GCN5-related N-acetyltransferase [Yersinia aldovae ATCC 35236]CNL00501.1 N-acetyltransferase GCN5 [Yersinia aldovae]